MFPFKTKVHENFHMQENNLHMYPPPPERGPFSTYLAFINIIYQLQNDLNIQFISSDLFFFSLEMKGLECISNIS